MLLERTIGDVHKQVATYAKALIENRFIDNCREIYAILMGNYMIVDSLVEVCIQDKSATREAPPYPGLCALVRNKR